MAEFRVLDTGKFDDFIGQKDNLIKRYNELSEEYDTIVKNLLENWKGRGAKAFDEDAKAIKMNIAGLHEILNSMCDVLIDCKEVFVECDEALCESNKTAFDA